MSKLNDLAVLYVDDETKSVKWFEKGFEKNFTLFTAKNATEGWEILQQHHEEIGLVMSDQRMPGQSGVEFLERIRQAYPYIVRILVTAYSDIDSAVQAVNAAGIYRYISKPWEASDLHFTLLRALEFSGMLRERSQLLRQKLTALQRIILLDQTKNLGLLAAGLSCRYQNTLTAASRFIDAVPADVSPPNADRLALSTLGEKLQSMIRRSCHQILDIAKTLNAMETDESAAPAGKHALPALLGPAIEAVSRGSATPPSSKLDANLPKISAHPKQVQKLFEILLNNLAAVADTPQRIVLESGPLEEQSGSRFVPIRLCMDGADWSHEQRVRFFAPFSSLETDGPNLGLDLAAAYFLVHHLGGRIEVIGSAQPRVVVYLPVEAPVRDGEALAASAFQDLFFNEKYLGELLQPGPLIQRSTRPEETTPVASRPGG